MIATPFSQHYHISIVAEVHERWDGEIQSRLLTPFGAYILKISPRRDQCVGRIDERGWALIHLSQTC